MDQIPEITGRVTQWWRGGNLGHRPMLGISTMSEDSEPLCSDVSAAVGRPGVLNVSITWTLQEISPVERFENGLDEYV